MFLDHQKLHPFPTRRSSDLAGVLLYWPGALAHDSALRAAEGPGSTRRTSPIVIGIAEHRRVGDRAGVRDRKSTRLNSSHLVISYAVFCLKKKKTLDQKTH